MPSIPQCPKCGAGLTLRRRKKDGKEFFGCERYPECKHTEPLPAYAEMKKRNAPVLPGWEDISS